MSRASEVQYSQQPSGDNGAVNVTRKAGVGVTKSCGQWGFASHPVRREPRRQQSSGG